MIPFDPHDHGPCVVCGNPAILHGPKRSPYPTICRSCWVSIDGEDTASEPSPSGTMLYSGHMDPATGTIADFGGRE